MLKGFLADSEGNLVFSWNWKTSKESPFPECLNPSADKIALDVTDMPEDEWEEIHRKLGEHRVELDDKGKHRKDGRGLPKIIKK